MASGRNESRSRAGCGRLVASAGDGWYKRAMTIEEFRASLGSDEPQGDMPAPLMALWWDAKGDWKRAHGMVDELETPDAMAVHAYLHRKEGVEWNAEYWYKRAGRKFRRETLEAELEALVEMLGTRDRGSELASRRVSKAAS
jgi:hypothetical protein